MVSVARKLQLSVLDSNAGFPLEQRTQRPEAAEHESLRWSEALGAWIVLGHEDVKGCLRDSRLGTSRVDFHEAPLQGPGEELLQAFRKSVSARSEDGRELVALRRQAAPGFSPEALDAWRPAIIRLARQLVTRVRGQGRMDAVRALTGILPALVLAEVLGIPEREREGFLAWARAIADVQAPAADLDGGTLARRALLATREFLDSLGPLLAERRRTPGEDLLSRMLQVQPPGPVSPEQRVSHIALLLLSGLSSFGDQLGNGLYELWVHPARIQRLRADPSRVRGAVEEVLRLSPAVPVLQRTALETFSLRGQTLRKGEPVLLCLSAANRDAAVFSEPECFDLDRDSARQKHLSLGFGLHYRLDAGLVKHTLKALIEVVLEELPGSRLDEERASRLKSQGLHARGFESLPVRW